jgi:hypothetical protein
MAYDEALAERAGFIFVAADGVATDADFCAWVERCESFVRTLPPK